MNVNDAKYAALKSLGITEDALPDMTRAWLIQEGADVNNGDTLPDLSWDFLTRVEGLSGSLSDMWDEWLDQQGQTEGAISDRWLGYWLSLLP